MKGDERGKLEAERELRTRSKLGKRRHKPIEEIVDARGE